MIDYDLVFLFIIWFLLFLAAATMKAERRRWGENCHNRSLLYKFVIVLLMIFLYFVVFALYESISRSATLPKRERMVNSRSKSTAYGSNFLTNYIHMYTQPYI